ncbi:MAG: hypothetical protein E7244_27790 [Enterocloster citroniae]|nr:hypothetical protein [Enterocloster citroniae]
MAKESRKNFLDIAKTLSPEEVQPMNELICAAMKNLGGRPYKYPNSNEGLEAFVTNSTAYFEYIAKANKQINNDKRNLIQSIESYALFLGITRKTLAEYEKRGGIWKELIDFYKNSIAASNMDLVLRGAIPSIVGVWYFINNFGYFNTNEFKKVVVENITTENEDDISLEQRCADLGLIWSEEKGEWIHE